MPEPDTKDTAQIAAKAAADAVAQQSGKYAVFVQALPTLGEFVAKFTLNIIALGVVGFGAYYALTQPPRYLEIINSNAKELESSRQSADAKNEAMRAGALDRFTTALERNTAAIELNTRSVSGRIFVPSGTSKKQ